MNATIVAFLLLGHALGDFAWQGRALAERKAHSNAALLQHLSIMLLAHTVALVPLWLAGGALTSAWIGMLPSLVLAHGLIDFVKIRVERRLGPSLTTFLLDQAAHFACLVAASALIARFLTYPQRSYVSLIHLAVLATAYVLVTLAGSTIVRLMLARHQLPTGAQTTTDGAAPPATMPLRMGHTIGVLERALGLTFVLIDAWTGLAGIIAVKSIARFKDLEQRPFGEYFLVGSLTSMLVTVAIGLGVKLLGQMPV